MSEVVFRRGSTPIHTFACPYEAKDLEDVWVSYSQNKDRIVLRKTMEHGDCVPDGETLTVRLSQEDTLKFKAGTGEVQVRLYFKSGDSLPSDIFSYRVLRVLDDEVMT